MTFRQFLILEAFATDKNDAMLRSSPAIVHSPGYVDVKQVFGNACAPIDVCKIAWALLDQIKAQGEGNFPPVTMVRTKRLIPCQYAVHSDNLKHHLMQSADKPIHVMLYNRNFYIMDGHHRVATAALKGKPEVKAWVHPYPAQ